MRIPNSPRAQSLATSSSHRRSAMRLGLATVASVLTTVSAFADDLIVRYDQSQLLRLPRAVSQVIIGNPSIADASVQASNLLVVTGKTFGVTNIIALDKQGNVIQDQRVIVQRDDLRMVNLHKGSQRQSFTCAPNCTPTVTIGDDKNFFEKISQHAKQKTQFSQSESDGGGGGAQ
jgi:Flp pilus assembly secretin CpaC